MTAFISITWNFKDFQLLLCTTGTDEAFKVFFQRSVVFGVLIAIFAIKHSRVLFQNLILLML